MGFYRITRKGPPTPNKHNVEEYWLGEDAAEAFANFASVDETMGSAYFDGYVRMKIEDFDVVPIADVLAVVREDALKEAAKECEARGEVATQAVYLALRQLAEHFRFCVKASRRLRGVIP